MINLHLKAGGQELSLIIPRMLWLSSSKVRRLHSRCCKGRKSCIHHRVLALECTLTTYPTPAQKLLLLQTFLSPLCFDLGAHDFVVLLVTAAWQLPVLGKQVNGGFGIVSKAAGPEEPVPHEDTIFTQISLCTWQKPGGKKRTFAHNRTATNRGVSSPSFSTILFYKENHYSPSY